MFRKAGFVIILLVICQQANAQLQYVDSLNHLAHQMGRGENDFIRRTAANIFENLMEKIVSDSSSFNQPFDSIKNISVKAAPDQSFRIYTWQYPNFNGDHYYYFGFLQVKNPKSDKVTFFRLMDSSYLIQKPMSKKLKPENWYGCIYYSIIENKKGGKKYYTLLGWRGKNQQFTEKVIDVISFNNGKPVFGFPVFKNNNIYRYRVVFEFTSQATMALRYEVNQKLIVFDHLSTGNKMYSAGSAMGPDGSYDAYKLTKKGYWELEEDVDVNQGFVPKKKQMKLYKDDEPKK